MNKYTITGVLLLMSISLLGVVGLQLYWINNAIEVKQQQFDRSVNDALAKVVEKLETREAVAVVTQQMAALKAPEPAPPSPPLTAEAPPQDKAKPRPAKAKAKASAPEEAPAKAPSVQIHGRTVPAPYTDTVTVPAKQEAQRQQQDLRQTVQLHVRQADSLFLRKRLLGSGQAKGAKNEKTPTRTKRSRQIYRSMADTLLLLGLKAGAAYAEAAAQRQPDFLRIQEEAITFSVDTLRHMAIRLDSLQFKTSALIANNLNPADMASIKVTGTDVLILNKAGNKPVYVRGTASQPAVPGVTSWHGVDLIRQTPPAQPPSPPKDKDNAAAPATNQQKNTARVVQAEGKDRKKAALKKDKLNDVVQKMVVEYVEKDVPLEKRLNLDNLPKLLRTELQNQGIGLEFGYWVITGKNDTVSAQPVKAPGETKDFQTYRASLFPNDIFDKSDYLGIYFPDSKSYALQSLWGMLALSALFTMIMLATFGTTIHIIYRQKKLSDMKNDFINNMTHEFKTPIATISLATDSIANPKVYEKPDRIKYYTHIIRQENKRMNAQVENVLQIALLEKNEFRMNLQLVDVHALIIKAIECIGLQVEQRLGQLSVQLDAQEHELPSDEVHLYNVICNLIDNAIKYSPASPDIKLTTQNVTGGLLIAVEDKGIGMSRDTQQRVFDKFYRVPTGNLHNVKGFGLGLSYVKAIVQAHHGGIKLKSELGKGSRFEIFLPKKY